MPLNFESWTAPDKGALFVITGSSGTGKTTLVREALAKVPGLKFSVSATTRANVRALGPDILPTI